MILLANVHSDVRYLELDTLILDHVSSVVMHEGSKSCLVIYSSIKNLVDSIILRIYLIFMTFNIQTFIDDS